MASSDDEVGLSEAQTTFITSYDIVVRTVVDREEEGTAAMKDLKKD